MSEFAKRFRQGAGKNDRLRDKDKVTPDDVIRCDNIQYNRYVRYGLLDVYRPKNISGKLPVIVSIHGGGYVYGSKEVYQYYCMFLAQQGYAVINFNYRLAPKFKFPAPLVDTNTVLTWACENRETYGFDLNNVYLVGDSAGAQITSQYAAIWANPSYAALFPFQVPNVRIAAVGLNCGMYDNEEVKCKDVTSPILIDYFGKEHWMFGEMLCVLENINGNYPPSFVLSSGGDFLKHNCEPMAEFLRMKDIPVQSKIYGDDSVKHVFHVDIATDIAKEANLDQIAFFKQFQN